MLWGLSNTHVLLLSSFKAFVLGRVSVAIHRAPQRSISRPLPGLGSAKIGVHAPLLMRRPSHRPSSSLRPPFVTTKPQEAGHEHRSAAGNEMDVFLRCAGGLHLVFVLFPHNKSHRYGHPYSHVSLGAAIPMLVDERATPCRENTQVMKDVDSWKPRDSYCSGGCIP